MFDRGVRVLALAVVVAVCAGGGRAEAQTTISLSGSSTMLPLMADLTYYYRRAESRPPRVELRGGGSATGAADALRRIVSAGMVSRDREAGDPAELVFTPIAYSGVCLVTNADNAVPNLTRAQVQDLVAARATDWAQIPGATQTGAISGAALALGTGARSTFLSTFVDDATPLAYAPRTFATARAVRAHISATPGAWGYNDLALSDGLHRVPFEGIPCDASTIASGAYPARRSLNIVTRGRPNRAVARFLGWIRTDPTARRVIATRYVSVNPSGN